MLNVAAYSASSKLWTIFFSPPSTVDGFIGNFHDGSQASEKEDERSTQASEEFIAIYAFSEMDQNHDGEVSKEEFVRAVLEQEQFSKLLTVNIMSIFIDSTD